MDKGAQELLGLIRSGQAVSRGQLVKVSGLARATVATRLDQLIDSGLIVGHAQVRDTGGRPAERLSINPDRGVLLVVDMGGSHTRVGIADLAGRLLGSRDHFVDVNEGPERLFEIVERDFDEMLGTLGRSAESVFGIGIGIPGPVEHETGRIVSPPTMRGWDGYVVPDRFREKFAAPVAVDKDANIMALGEYRALDSDARDVLVLKVGMGIGAGIIANGRIVRGGQGAAGDLGHLPRRNGVLCRCGQVGCVEATAGGWAIASSLRDAGYSGVRTSDDILELSRAGNPDAVDQLRQAGQRLGEVTADAVGLLNPTLVIVGGNLASSSDALLAGIRERIYERSHPLATKNLRIVTSVLGRNAGLVGAAILAADTAFQVPN
jgi:predicted NBD/HSP70 family sugar kinase